jgi:hypothetical protein
MKHLGEIWSSNGVEYETSVTFYHKTRRNIPEDIHLDLKQCVHTVDRYGIAPHDYANKNLRVSF